MGRRTFVLHGSSTAHRLLHEWVLSLQSFTFYFSASSCPPVLPTIRANTPRCDVNGGSFRPRNVGSGLRPSMYSSPSCNAARDVDLGLLVPCRSPPRSQAAAVCSNERFANPTRQRNQLFLRRCVLTGDWPSLMLIHLA